MMYDAPIRDIMFNIEHLSFWPELQAAGQTDVDLDDATAVLEQFGRFCSEKIAPLSQSGDEVGARFDGERVHLPNAYADAYGQFVEMGWQGLAHPVEYGGAGMPRALGAAASEILNSADMSLALCPLLTDGAIEALLTCGSEDQKALYLPKLITGQWSGTMNLTEPQAGSDLGLVRARAEPNGDGSYAVHGTKIYITFGEHDLSENIIHLVLARAPGAPDGPKGLSLFLVPKINVKPDGSLGARNAVRCVSIEHKLGVRASPTAVLEYAGATGYLIGEKHRGLDYMFVMMNAARFAVGVQGVAVAERATQRAVAYAKDRVQSRPVDGSANEAVPIVVHPDVRRMLMRMRALTDGGRALAATTAAWLDRAHHQGGATQGEAQGEALRIAEFLVPLVKGYCTERAVEIASLGVQVHGGMGFIEETGAAQHFRDSRILPIYEGTTAIQANDLLGRKTLRDRGATAHRFAEMIAETETQLRAGSPVAQRIADRLAQGRSAFLDSMSYLLDTAPQDPNAAFAGSVPYLMLTGNLAIAWQFGRSVVAAEAALASGENADFLKRKIETAAFYADHILIETEVERSRITSGAETLLAAAI
ncbi:MAG: acyl-CoA dehydrogenase [Pseudomonadota bacterium]